MMAFDHVVDTMCKANNSIYMEFSHKVMLLNVKDVGNAETEFFLSP